MQWYPWLTPVYKSVTESLMGGRPHHALLFSYPDDYGFQPLTDALSRWLLCEHKEGIKICGQCHSCRLMDAGNHPDCYTLDAENKTIGIDPVRELIRKLNDYAKLGGAKVIVIPHVEQLSVAGANALLKTLEEPSADTYFLLGCHEPNQLMATIRSRCLHWALANPAENYSQQWLQRELPQLTEMAILTALRLSEGTPLKAQQLLTSDAWQHRLTLVETFYQAVNCEDELALLPLLNNDQCDTALCWILQLLMDIRKWQEGAFDTLAHLDKHDEIAALAQRLTAEDVLVLYTAWQTCREQLRTIAGVNRELLLANLLINTECLIGNL